MQRPVEIAESVLFSEGKKRVFLTFYRRAFVAGSKRGAVVSFILRENDESEGCGLIEELCGGRCSQG